MTDALGRKTVPSQQARELVLEAAERMKVDATGLVRYPRPDYTFVPEAVDKAYPYRYTLVMTSVDDDEPAKAAVERVKDQLTDPEQLRWVGYRQIVEVCRRQDELDAWADHFTQRYLDLSPLGKN